MYLNELPRENITDFFNLAHTLMCSDGKVDEKENLALQGYVKEFGLEEMPEFQKVDYAETLKKMNTLSYKVKIEIFFELMSLAYIDTEFAFEERTMLEKVAEEFGIEKEKCDKIENITKKLLKIYEKLGEIFEDTKAQERL